MQFVCGDVCGDVCVKKKVLKGQKTNKQTVNKPSSFVVAHSHCIFTA